MIEMITGVVIFAIGLLLGGALVLTGIKQEQSNKE